MPSARIFSTMLSLRRREAEYCIVIQVTARTPRVHWMIGAHGIMKGNSTGSVNIPYIMYAPRSPSGIPMSRDFAEHRMLSRFSILLKPPRVIPTLCKIANSRERERTFVDMVLITLVRPMSVSMMMKP